MGIFMKLTLIFIALLHSASALATSYAVILNAENDFSGDPRIFYTLQKSQWPSGDEVAPAAIKVGSSLEKGVILSGFVKRVLKLGGISEYREYWIRQKSKGQTRRPIDQTSFKAILKFVSREPGGIGYVPSDLARGNNKVRILLEFNP